MQAKARIVSLTDAEERNCVLLFFMCVNVATKLTISADAAATEWTNRHAVSAGA